jgi:hypothetical protein
MKSILFILLLGLVISCSSEKRKPQVQHADTLSVMDSMPVMVPEKQDSMKVIRPEDNSNMPVIKPDSLK